MLKEHKKASKIVFFIYKKLHEAPRFQVDFLMFEQENSLHI